MFIRGETLSADIARPLKIPGWTVVVLENVFFVNTWAYIKLNNINRTIKPNERLTGRLKWVNLLPIISVRLSIGFIDYFSLLILIETKSRLHSAAVCTSGPCIPQFCLHWGQ